MACKEGVWHARKGCSIQGRGVAYKEGVWHTRKGCGIQGRGVAYKEGVWHTRKGCGIQGRGVAYKDGVWHTRKGCGIQGVHKNTGHCNVQTTPLSPGLLCMAACTRECAQVHMLACEGRTM